MNVKDPWSVKQLIAAAQRLHASRLYRRFSDGDCFLIRSPKLEAPAVAALMGQGGQTFGVNVFLGDNALASYLAMFRVQSEAQANQLMLRRRVLGYAMVAPGRLTHDARRWLKKAKVRLEVDQLYPDPLSLHPGKVPAMPKDGETRLLLHMVEGILTASNDKAFEPCGIDERGRVLAVHLSEDGQATMAWEDAGIDHPSMPNVPGPARFDLAGLDSSGDSWMIALLPLPASVEDDDRQPYVLAICSEQSDSIFPAMVMGAEPAEVIETLVKLMRGEAFIPEEVPFPVDPPQSGLPARLICDSDSLYDTVRDTFEPLGVRCIDGSTDPGVQALVESLHNIFHSGLIDESDDTIDHDQIPAADDLDGWKQVDGWLKDAIYERFEYDRRYHGKRALKTYFGSAADARKLLERYRRLMVIDSYAQWFATSYRSARNRPTLAEQWLDDVDVPAAVKVLLRSILESAPTIYRVDDADEDTGKITFVDVFTGETIIATDFALSTCLDTGTQIPARLVPAGEFHFFYPAGPALGNLSNGAVMAHFEAQRITPSPQYFHEHPHALGRLWDVVDRSEERGIDLRNSDGDPLLHQSGG